MLCVCMWMCLCARGEIDSECRKNQVVSDFHDECVVDRGAILTRCHFVFVWLYSQSTEACSHTSVPCHNGPSICNAVAAMA